MSVGLNALILWSAQAPRVAAFYRMLGLPLADEDHGDGHVHQACELGPVHIAVYDATDPKTPPKRREAGGSLIGFAVLDLDRVLAALKAAGEYRELVAKETMDWGVRVVLEDPDGRSVELTRS